MGEVLLYNGKKYHMTSLPFSDYLDTRKDIILFQYHTANYRGYFGKWEVRDNKLYLIDLDANVAGTKGVELDYFFPGQSEVFAEWFSGEVELELGEILEYVHAGFGSVFEKEIHLFFENGILISESEVDNREKYQKPIKPLKLWWLQIVEKFKRKKNSILF